MEDNAKYGENYILRYRKVLKDEKELKEPRKS